MKTGNKMERERETKGQEKNIHNHHLSFFLPSSEFGHMTDENKY